MGNFQAIAGCGFSQISEISTLAQDVGLLPNSSMDPLFTTYLSLNSSVHLSKHYADVRGSLTPEELVTFNQSLESRFGPSGMVRMGGVGVVALALSLLFDSLALEAKGLNATDDPIQRAFARGLEGPSSVGGIASDYLKLVPYIANEPEKMKEETERYRSRINATLIRQLDQALTEPNISIGAVREGIHGMGFYLHLKAHQTRKGMHVPSDFHWSKSFEQRLDQLWKVVEIEMASRHKTWIDKSLINTLRNLTTEHENLLTACKAEIVEEQVKLMYYMDINKFVRTTIDDWQGFVDQRDDFFLFT